MARVPGRVVPIALKGHNTLALRAARALGSKAARSRRCLCKLHATTLPWLWTTGRVPDS
jgi:hypothetical protein